MQSFAENLYGTPPTKNDICAVPYDFDKIIGSIGKEYSMESFRDFPQKNYFVSADTYP